MAQRMTWGEIVRAYPQQFVYLTDIQRDDDEKPETESAVVLYATPQNDNMDYIMRSARGECVERYTDIEAVAPMGALVL